MREIKYALFKLGASTVKYIAPLHCISLNERVSKLYAIFEFYEEKNHKHLKNILIYKAKQFMLTKQISRKVYIF